MKDRNWDKHFDTRKPDPVKDLLKQADKLIAAHPDKPKKQESPKKYAKRRAKELRAKANQWAVTK